ADVTEGGHEDDGEEDEPALHPGSITRPKNSRLSSRNQGHGGAREEQRAHGEEHDEGERDHQPIGLGGGPLLEHAEGPAHGHELLDHLHHVVEVLLGDGDLREEDLRQDEERYGAYRALLSRRERRDDEPE